MDCRHEVKKPDAPGLRLLLAAAFFAEQMSNVDDLPIAERGQHLVLETA